MHRKTQLIIKNLGFSEDLIKKIKDEARSSGSVLNDNVITILKAAGTPEMALRQIEEFEKKRKPKIGKIPKLSNKEMIEDLIKKCQKSISSFIKKGIPLVINFKDKNWYFDGDETQPAIKKLLETCTKYFDEFAKQGGNVLFKFDKNLKWTIVTEKKSDLPDISGSI